MQQLVLEATERARTDTALRGMTSRIREHFEIIERRMHEKQTLWGGDLTVIDGETEKLSATVRRSLAFEKVMREMPIEAEPYALLAGSCMKDGVIVRCMLPSFIIDAELGKCNMGISHKCPDYETLLNTGISGVLQKLEDSMSALRQSGAPDATKLDFYEAVKRECLAVITLARRYADLAEARALPELARICRRVPEFPAETFHEALQSLWFINHVFRETMTHLSLGHIDSILNPYFEKDLLAGNITLERAQELVDAFDLCVNERAQLNPENYVVNQNELPGAPKQFKIGYSEGFVSDRDSDQSDAINHWGQNILLSGLRPDGSDGTGALTYLFLNAHEKFKMTSPVLTVRLHRGSPPELLERVAEVLRTGGGMPFINNDDVIVSAYEKLGVTREDACAYANSNCWETLIQGRSNQEMIRFVNFLYLLELALNRGKSLVYADMKRPKPRAEGAPVVYGMGAGPSNPVTDGPDTGDPAGFASVGDIIEAWKRQLDYMLENSMEHVVNVLNTTGSHGKYSSNPLLSALTRDCVGSLTDITHSGARYTLWHMMGEAVSNAADALSAIQKFVFDEKLVSLPRLAEILRSDWEGEDALRQRFASGAPRFGNGLAKPDGFAAEMVEYFTQRVHYFAKKHTAYIFSPCIGTFSWVITIGKKIGASADGRKSRELIAANMSPVPGVDVSGPTAALNSYFKLNTKDMAAGAPIDLRVSSNGLEGPEGISRIAALIKTFIAEGGNMMTLTVTSAEELRRAMAEPEKYRGLRVRMGGWSAYFVLLSKEAQQLHLSRAEHGI